MDEFSKKLHDFSIKYQEEVGEQGHNIPKLLAKAKKKNDLVKIKEYESSIRINDNLDKISKKYDQFQTLNSQECDQLQEGVNSWKNELEFWTNKWYIKPFISSRSHLKQHQYIDQVQQTQQSICKTTKK